MNDSQALALIAAALLAGRSQIQLGKLNDYVNGTVQDALRDANCLLEAAKEFEMELDDQAREAAHEAMMAEGDRIA